jgi:hypothetical protein
MSRSVSLSAVHDPLEPLIRLAHVLAWQTIELACGLALGAAAARVLRARGMHWSWAALAVGVVVLLRSLEGAWTTVALVASAGTLVRCPLNPSSQHSTMLNPIRRSCDGEEAQGVLGG